MTALRHATYTALAALLTAGAPAFAKDLCFYENGSTTPLLVARGWKLPSPGKCRPFLGTGGTTGMAHGTVCRNAAGTVLRFGITLTRQSGIFSPATTRQISMGMNYPALTSSGAEVIVVTSGETAVTSEFLGALEASVCTPPDIS